jgi:hypothetical protein
MYLVLFSYVRDKAFPVPDPNRATDRTGNCIAADAIGDANEKCLERRVLQRWVEKKRSSNTNPNTNTG